MQTFPRGFLPVTTFGGDYPLDRLIQPFLPRFAPAVMVSYHFARNMPEGFPLPAFIDSGGFSALLPGATVRETAEGLGVIEREDQEPTETIHPDDVHALQSRLAHWGCPLDFPIPPAITDPDERARRLRLTLANARYALTLPCPERLTLFGVVVGWDAPSYAQCARELQVMGYRHLAIGGLVPRLGDLELVERIVRAVRALQAETDGLHLFGLGHPDRVAQAMAWGASSTDSSSYVQHSARGRCWEGEMPDDPSPLERAHAALRNLQAVTLAISAAEAVSVR